MTVIIIIGFVLAGIVYTLIGSFIFGILKTTTKLATDDNIIMCVFWPISFIIWILYKIIVLPIFVLCRMLAKLGQDCSTYFRHKKSVVPTARIVKQGESNEGISQDR